jgi:hypothetical protein
VVTSNPSRGMVSGQFSNSDFQDSAVSMPSSVMRELRARQLSPSLPFEQ